MRDANALTCSVTAIHIDETARRLPVVTYGAQAEAVEKHMAKSRRVSVTGRLEYRESDHRRRAPLDPRGGR